MRLARVIAALAIGLTLASPQAAAPPLAQLPLIERPAAGGGDTLAVFYSGDGGWAGLDRGLTDQLARAGVPVVGVDSLHYFWNRKSPQQAAADLNAVLQHYLAAWRKSKVILAGYSFGANALPAIVAQLPPETRGRIRLVALVAADRYGDLQFHLGSWLDEKSSGAYPLAPILADLKDVPMVCIYGDRDRTDACPTLAPGTVRPIRVAGGHHFDGDFSGLGLALLKSAGL